MSTLKSSLRRNLTYCRRCKWRTFFDLPHIAKAETNAAPPFTVTDMNGQTVSLASLKGKPVFLNFGLLGALPVLEKCLISKECMLNMEIKFILLSST